MKIVRLLAGAGALASCAIGLVLATQNFVDFQIDGAKGILSGVNIYDPSEFSARSAPNYGHLLYFILSPLTILGDLTARTLFAVLNLTLSVVVLMLIARRMGLRSSELAHVALILFLSTPFRVTLGNSQTSLLFLFLILLFSGKSLRFFGYGLGAFKFSFAPPFATLAVISGPRALVAFGSAVTLPALAAVAITSDFSTMVGPLARQIGAPQVAFGYGDLLTLFRHLGIEGAFVTLGVACLCALASLLLLRSHEEVGSPVIGALILSLLFLPHLIYDFVVLIVPYAWFISRPKSRLRSAGLLSILAIMFLQTVSNLVFVSLRRLGVPSNLSLDETSVFSCLLIFTLLVTLLSIYKREQISVSTGASMSRGAARSALEERGHRRER
jgi:hypothetical protein